MIRLFGALALAALLGWFGPALDDNGHENAIAADLEEAQRAEWALSDRMAHSDRQIAKCLEERGAGAAVLFDEDGFYRDCKRRRS